MRLGSPFGTCLACGQFATLTGGTSRVVLNVLPLNRSKGIAGGGVVQYRLAAEAKEGLTLGSGAI